MKENLLPTSTPHPVVSASHTKHTTQSDQPIHRLDTQLEGIYFKTSNFSPYVSPNNMPASVTIFSQLQLSAIIVSSVTMGADSTHYPFLLMTRAYYVNPNNSA